ncbi:MAG: hypothetical protein ACTSYI_00025 [Promethearchaeota archaeon]
MGWLGSRDTIGYSNLRSLKNPPVSPIYKTPTVYTRNTPNPKYFQGRKARQT